MAMSDGRHNRRTDRNALIVIKEMRTAAKVAGEHNDPGTIDLLSRFVQIYEKREWCRRRLY
jgi:DNA-binding ferritin-like protein